MQISLRKREEKNISVKGLADAGKSLKGSTKPASWLGIKPADAGELKLLA
jgi:hypothetical protein